MAGVALATALLFSLAPALQVVEMNLTDALKRRRRDGWRVAPAPAKALVVAEIALAFVLLVGAGLMARTLVNLLTSTPDSTSEHVLTVPISLAVGSTARRRRIDGGVLRELLDACGAARCRTAPGSRRTCR